MHDCQKFREDWSAGIPADVLNCEDCQRFCAEAGTVLAAFDASEPHVPEASEEYWTRFDTRLRARLDEEHSTLSLHASRRRWIAVFATAASVMVVVTWGSLRLSGPAVNPPEHIAFADDHITGLDSHVVGFLGQSEQFLRDFTKIDPSHTEDIEDARARASRNLGMLTVQKKASEDFAPVRIALDEYESVLREIKNMDSPEGMAEIRMRIQRNGLIANLKAYQPRVILVGQR